MNKKKFIIGAILLFIVLEIIIWYFSFGLSRIILMLALGGTACLLFALLQLFCKRINGEMPSSYFQDLGKRNLDALVLGSSQVWKYCDNTNVSVYHCAAYKKSLFMDFCYLKTYFSHIKKNGKVFIFVDYLENIELREKVSLLDIKCIHPHLFLQLESDGIIKKRKPFVKYDIKYAIGYLCSLLGKRFNWVNAFWDKKNKKLNADDIEYIYNLLLEMIEFCRERSLNPRICLINSGKTNELANIDIMTKLKEVKRSGEFSVIMISDLRQFLQEIYNQC